MLKAKPMATEKREHCLQLRVTTDEYNEIVDASQALGVSMSAYVRWCAAKKTCPTCKQPVGVEAKLIAAIEDQKPLPIVRTVAVGIDDDDPIADESLTRVHLASYVAATKKRAIKGLKKQVLGRADLNWAADAVGWH
jgi:hypothetical protein